MDGSKKCSRCGRLKPLKFFYQDKKLGTRPYCISCCRSLKKAARAAREAVIGESIPAEKECLMCKQTLPASEFYKNVAAAAFLNPRCKECQSIDKRAKKYRLTVEEVTAYLAVPECQNPMCRAPFAPGKEGDKQMQFDHCHGRGHLRGVLCSKCNTAAAGKVYECIERLRGLVQYLEDSEARRVERRATCHSA